MRLYTTADIQAMGSNILKRSFAANLMRISPNGGGAPLLAMSGFAKQRTISSVAHSDYLKRSVFPSITLAAQAAAADTTFTVTDSGEVVPGNLLLVYKSTNTTVAAPELVRVLTVASGTSITVARAQGGTTAAIIPNNTTLMVVGTAFEEGSEMPVAQSVAMEEHTNFTQIFRNSWDITRTAEAVAIEPDTTVIAENKRDAAEFHAQSMEWAAIFGRKSATTVNGRPMRTMDGIESIITQFAPDNISAAGTTTTYSQLEKMLHKTLRQGAGPGHSRHRQLLCGPTAIEVINDIGRKTGEYQIQQGQTSFGMQFDKFKTSRGTFEMIEHPLLGTSAALSSMVIVADVNTFDFLYLRKTKHEEVAFSGRDATAGVFTTEMTIQLRDPTAWGIIHGLTAAA